MTGKDSIIQVSYDDDDDDDDYLNFKLVIYCEALDTRFLKHLTCVSCFPLTGSKHTRLVCSGVFLSHFYCISLSNSCVLNVS